MRGKCFIVLLLYNRGKDHCKVIYDSDEGICLGRRPLVRSKKHNAFALPALLFTVLGMIALGTYLTLSVKKFAAPPPPRAIVFKYTTQSPYMKVETHKYLSAILWNEFLTESVPDDTLGYSPVARMGFENVKKFVASRPKMYKHEITKENFVYFNYKGLHYCFPALKLQLPQKISTIITVSTRKKCN